MRWTYDGPNIVEFVLELLVSLFLTLMIVAVAVPVFGWPEPDQWVFLALFLINWNATKIRFKK